VFNVSTSPGEAAETCPRTGAPHRLIQRPDDNEATVAERLRVYEEKTRPLIEFYRARGLLRVIHAEGGVEEVTRRLEQALHAAAAPAARGRGKKTGGAKPPGGSPRSAKPHRGKSPSTRSRSGKQPRTASARGSKGAARKKSKRAGASRAVRSSAARRGRRR
jgi:hypothetical protein